MSANGEWKTVTRRDSTSIILTTLPDSGLPKGREEGPLRWEAQSKTMVPTALCLQVWMRRLAGLLPSAAVKMWMCAMVAPGKRLRKIARKPVISRHESLSMQVLSLTQVAMDPLPLRGCGRPRGGACS